MDGNSWFCQVNGQQYGPYTYAQLRQFVAEGRVHPASFIRQAHSNSWIPAGSVAGLFAAAQPTQTPTAVGASPASYGAYPTAPTAATAAVPTEQAEPIRRKKPFVALLLIALVATAVGGFGCYVFVTIARQRTEIVNAEPTEERPGHIQIAPEHIQAALDSVPHWTDALNVNKLGSKSNSYRIELDGVWAPPKEKGASDRYIYVKITVLNPQPSRKPLHYLTWNREAMANQMPSAVMVDSHGELCPLSSTYSSGSPKDEVQVLDPGDFVEDVLAFAYPKTSFDHVNLALSYNAINQGKGYFGFKIPKSMMSDDRVDPTKLSRRGESKSRTRGKDEEPTLEEINRQNERNAQKMRREKNSEQ